MSQNEKIISEFEKLIKSVSYAIDSEPDKKERMKNLFRLKQFNNALTEIQKYPKKITAGSDLKEIRGIGTGIMTRIDEILKTGKLAEIKTSTEKMDVMKYIEDLKEIYGIGDKIAYELVTKYNIKNIDDLRKSYKQGKVQLSNNILMGMKYHNVYQPQIPRQEVTIIDKYLTNMAKQTDPKLIVTICGSYRRKKPFSNDIDCMIVHPDIKTINDLKTKTNYLTKFIHELSLDGFILDSLTGEDVETKYMGFCRYSKKHSVRRIDIRYMPYNSYYSALLYFTGSGSFNQRMRQLFKKKGYKLNEYGLYKISGEKLKSVELNSEKDAFDILGMDYLKPEERIM